MLDNASQPASHWSGLLVGYASHLQLFGRAQHCQACGKLNTKQARQRPAPPPAFAGWRGGFLMPIFLHLGLCR